MWFAVSNDFEYRANRNSKRNDLRIAKKCDSQTLLGPAARHQTQYSDKERGADDRPDDGKSG
jgi:hypothetical protein